MPESVSQMKGGMIVAVLIGAIASGFIGVILTLGLGGSFWLAFLVYVICGALALLLPTLILTLRTGAPDCD